jgi:hypothetical protein
MSDKPSPKSARKGTGKGHGGPAKGAGLGDGWGGPAKGASKTAGLIAESGHRVAWGADEGEGDMKPRTMPPTLNEIIAAIRERDAGSPRRLCDPIRWDTALANEVERLRVELSLRS